jgi:hypothetical protein
LIFSILKILDGRFLVNLYDKKLVLKALLSVQVHTKYRQLYFCLSFAIFFQISEYVNFNLYLCARIKRNVFE